MSEDRDSCMFSGTEDSLLIAVLVVRRSSYQYAPRDDRRFRISRFHASCRKIPFGSQLCLPGENINVQVFASSRKSANQAKHWQVVGCNTATHTNSDIPDFNKCVDLQAFYSVHIYYLIERFPTSRGFIRLRVSWWITSCSEIERLSQHHATNCELHVTAAPHHIAPG